MSVNKSAPFNDLKRSLALVFTLAVGMGSAGEYTHGPLVGPPSELYKLAYELDVQSVYPHGGTSPASTPGRGFAEGRSPSGRNVGVEFSFSGKGYDVEQIFDLDALSGANAFRDEVLRTVSTQQRFDVSNY